MVLTAGIPINKYMQRFRQQEVLRQGRYNYEVKLIYGAGPFGGENDIARDSYELWKKTPFVESVLPIWKLN